MSQSQRLRLSEVRSLFRLVGECRELGADSRTWRLHALNQLRVLVGAQVGSVGESTAPAIEGTRGMIDHLDAGWSSPAARRYQIAYHQDQMLARDPFIRQFARLRGRHNTRSPEQLLELRQWHRSVSFNEYFRAAEVDAGLLSQHLLGNGLFSTLSFHRPFGEPLFGRRERRLVYLFHQEIGPLIGKSLARAREPAVSDLAPRVRQTLDCLLEGDSEKQAAARLGLSQTTVHDYVRTLYRHFGVSSRAELLAYFLRRLRGGARS